MESRLGPVELSSIRIPSLPDVVARLQTMLADPEVGLAELGAVVATDPPLAARVLRTANSAVYGLREPIQTVPRAAAVLGVGTLRNLVLQVCLVDAFAHLAADEAAGLERLWRHSIAAALAAQRQGMRAGRRLVDPYDAYTCALLHDLGKLVLFEACRERYLMVLHDSRRNGTGTFEFERERLGVTHTEVGGMLARAWSLPDEVAQAIRLHHARRQDLLLAPMAALVALADALVLAVEEGRLEGLGADLAGRAGAVLLDIGAEDLELVAAGVAETWGEIGGL